ncbi:MAG: hypothetical protein HUU11_04170 [Anaerolineales bacterium]|nr:hypothetical protein [Anaerolineales bacterium]
MLQKLSSLWNRIPSAWRFALAAFLVARLALTLWSFVVYWIFPVALQNLDLFGEPALTVFDLRTSERYAYSRAVGETTLTFRALDDQYMLDDQTGSVWSMREGRAIQGNYAGTSLKPSAYAVENIFPYLGVPPSQNEALALWQRFDTNWYLRIAAYGYQGLAGSTAYFPLYPILIRLLSFVIEPMIAAVLVSNIALFGVLVLLYRLVSRLADEHAARRTLIYFLVFPTSFFFMAAYTESLFLLFATGSLSAASRRHWRRAAALGMLSALTRLQGILLFFPLLYMIWNENKNPSPRNIFLRALPLVIIPAATLAFFIFSNFSMITALQGNWHASFVFPWANVWASITLLMSPDGGIIDTMNLIVTLGFIAMMFAIWKNLPVEYSLYSIVMLITPLFRMNATQPLVSMMRYALAIFPAFMVFGFWGENKWVNRVIVYLSLALQLYLSAQFILWGWVG